PVSIQACIVSESLGMPAKIDLIVCLVPIPQTHYDLCLIVPLKPGSRHDVENSIGTVSVIGFVTSSLNLQIVNILRVDLRAQIRGDIRIGYGHAVNQPVHLVASSHVQHVVGHIRSRHIVGDHLQRVGAVRAGCLSNVHARHQRRRRHGIDVRHSFRSFCCDGFGLIHRGDLELKMQCWRGSRNHGDRFLLVRKAASCHHHLVIPHWHCCEQKCPILVCLRRLRPIGGRRLQFHRSVSHWPVLWIVHHSPHGSKYGGRRHTSKQKYGYHEKQSTLQHEFFSVWWRKDPRRVAGTQNTFQCTKR